MGNKLKNILSIAILPLALLMSGCTLDSLFGGDSSELPPVGIYKTTDRGDTWVTANAVLSTGATKTLNSTNVKLLQFDPTDRQTIYMGSTNQGLFFTYDSADRWWQSGPIRSGAINAIAVVPQAELRCTVYIATANRILKTQDCGRFWDQVYYDTRLNEQVTALVVDKRDSKVVYAGMTTGDVLRSTDAGVSWQTYARMSGEVQILMQHALNNDTLYAVIKSQGFWKSTDAGATWQNMSEGMREFKNSLRITDIAIDQNRPDTVILASEYGLLRTTDGGVTWATIPLITDVNEAKIYSIAMNPQDPRQLYYTTNSTLYRSSDAGETWETRPLPARGIFTSLIVDPKLPSTLYLGVNRPAQQGGLGF